MKNKLKNKNIRDKASLKRYLKRAWYELPQEYIENALKSWPKRVLQIYKNRGGGGVILNTYIVSSVILL